MKNRSLLLIIFSATFLFSNAFVRPVAAQTQDVNIVLNNQQCVDIQTGKSGVGAYLVSAVCDNSAAQTFQMTNNSSTGFTTLSSKSGHCLELKNGYKGDAGLINLNNCDGSTNQLFEITKTQTNGTQIISSKGIVATGSNKCLDFRGNWLRTYTCDNSPEQSFSFNYILTNPGSMSDSQFLNNWAVKLKTLFPLPIVGVVLLDATPNCSFGCVSNKKAHFKPYLSISASTPKLSGVSVSKSQLERSLRPTLEAQYCSSGAAQKNISLEVLIEDMNRDFIGNFFIEPTDCPANVTPPSTNTSGNSNVEQQYWDAVKNSQKSSDFQSYLNTYPNGQYAPIARLRVNQLGGSVINPSPTPKPIIPSTTSSVEQQYWDAIEQSRRVQDFQNYLNDYPNGQFAPIARLKISQLAGTSSPNPTNNTSTPEEQYWNTISNSQRSQDFQGYLNNYPNGKYVSIARLKISQLGGTTTSPNNPNAVVEDQYWDNVKNSNRASDFQSYLNIYPNEKYSSIARLKINQLTAGNNSISTNNQQNNSRGSQILANAQFGAISEMRPLRKFWILTETGDLESKSIVTSEITREYPQLTAANRQEDADFFIVFSLTDQATGTIVTSNMDTTNQTQLGDMIVFTSVAQNNALPTMRILFKTQKTRVFSNSNMTFNRHPATNAAREFVKELKKINF